jgi:hypothetical protein
MPGPYNKKLRFLLVAFLIFFMPLSYGCVHPLPIVVFKILCLVSALLILTDKDKRHVINLQSKTPYILALFLIAVLAQIIPLPAFLIELLSPERYAFLYSHFASLELGNPPSFAALSVDPYSTAHHLSLLIYLCITYICLLHVTKDRRNVLLLSYVIISCGFLVSFLALAQKFSFAGAI